MPSFKNLLNQKFNRLTVLSFAGMEKGRSHWLCRCNCGTERVFSGNSISKGNTKSCGCLRYDNLLIKKKMLGLSLQQANPRLYRCWIDMKRRCDNQNRLEYKNYGGRGITVCEDWKGSFKSFADWSLANGYKENLEIDRYPNNDGNYEPSNCKWTDPSENSRRKRSTKLNWTKVMTIRNLYKIGAFTQIELSKIFSITPSTINVVIKNKTWNKQLVLEGQAEG